MIPAALTIAGLDPSGGAGVAADLRAFARAGAWGTAVCASLTVQSRRGVRAVEPVASALVIAQVEELLADMKVRALKTGALGSAENARAIAALSAAHPSIPAVVDPVMIPTRVGASGVRLDGAGAVDAMRALAAVATLVTPNRDEAAALLGAPLRTDDDARAAGAELVRRGARAALMKGGHGEGPEAVDWLVTRTRAVRLARPRIPPSRARFHGTGCALSALVAGRLALRSGRGRASEDDLVAAVRWARARLDAALRAPVVLGPTMRVPALDRRR
jgi:hydroxymethylpyrimidine/phosphomethylpyrimidine kinase